MRQQLFNRLTAYVSMGLAFGPAGSATAQPVTWDPSGTVAAIASRFAVMPNLTYLTVGGVDLKLDVYTPRDANALAPAPTVLYIHGGGWTGGDKAVAVPRLVPYLELGFAVVNINFRLGPAPAAVEDCRCALRWIARNASKYNFDVQRIVVTGDSSGSHLALTTGLMTPAAGFDEGCAGADVVRAAAVVSWFGVTDVADVIQGPNQKGYASRWFAGVSDPANLARRISPLHNVRADAPAVFTVHGDNDNVAPYAHATRLHEALDNAKVPNELMTIPGGDHGSFKREEFIRIYAAIREFLRGRGMAGRP